MEAPQALFIAFGGVTAALVAGFFSFLNLIGEKENKVSEFRQAWIDGLRTEIADYTAAVQSLARFRLIEKQYEDKPWYEFTESIYREVSKSLTKIQLRLNPVHAANEPQSNEAKLLHAVQSARGLINTGKFDEGLEMAQQIREVAAPLLKYEWERVKNGEPRYQTIRDSAQRTIRAGLILLSILALGLLIMSLVNVSA